MVDRRRRDRLVLANLHRVRQLAARLPQSYLTFDELVSAGNLGLVEAAERWDPRRNAGSFWPWASTRVRGAMFDAVREWTHYDRRSQTAPDSDLGLDLIAEAAPEKLGCSEDLDAIQIVDALRRIPKHQARLILRYLFLGHSMQEDADREGVTVSAISLRCRMAREAFAAALA